MKHIFIQAFLPVDPLVGYIVRCCDKLGLNLVDFESEHKKLVWIASMGRQQPMYGSIKNLSIKTITKDNLSINVDF